MTQKKQQLVSILIAGIISIIGFLMYVQFVIHEIKIEKTDNSVGQVGNYETKEQSENQVITLAQNFIVSMATYDQNQSSPILFKDLVQLSPQKYLIKFEVEQQFDQKQQVYYFSLIVEDLRIIQSAVSVSDISRTLLISTPEADQIVEPSTLMLKGQIFNDLPSIELSVQSDTGETITSNQLIELVPGVDVFSAETDLSSVLGNIQLVFTSGDISVTIPIVVNRIN